MNERRGLRGGRAIDASFTAPNFIAFTEIKTALDNSSEMSDIWRTLPGAIIDGELNNQLSWAGNKRQLMKIIYAKGMIRAIQMLANTAIATGFITVVTSMFHDGGLMPIIGVGGIVLGLLLRGLAFAYEKLRPKSKICMHTHGVFLWGKIEGPMELKKIMNRFG